MNQHLPDHQGFLHARTKDAHTQAPHAALLRVVIVSILLSTVTGLHSFNVAIAVAANPTPVRPALFVRGPTHVAVKEAISLIDPSA